MLHYIKEGTQKFWCGMGIWDDWSESGQYTTRRRDVTCRECLTAIDRGRPRIDRHAALLATIRSRGRRRRLGPAAQWDAVREEIERRYRAGELSDNEHDDLLNIWAEY